MKTTLWLTTLSFFFAAPSAFSATELETLRSKAAEQERQIRQLEEEITKLRSLAGQAAETPAESVTPQAKGTPAPASNKTYTVRAGDSIERIARKSGSTPQAIARLNGIKSQAILQIGQKLKVPGTETVPQSSSVTGSDTYIIRNGDTFYSIARKHRISPEALIAANPGINAAELRAGQLIRLTSKSSATATNSLPTKKNDATPVTNNSPAPATDAPTPKTAVHSVTIEGEMTYGEFAEKHGTKIERLNELNGLDLTQNTVLAKGSELYVNAQP